MIGTEDDTTRHIICHDAVRDGATCRRRSEPGGLCKHWRLASTVSFIRLIRRATAALFALRPVSFWCRGACVYAAYVHITRTVVGKRKCFSFKPGLVWSTLRLFASPPRDLLPPPRPPPHHRRPYAHALQDRQTPYTLFTAHRRRVSRAQESGTNWRLPRQKAVVKSQPLLPMILLLHRRPPSPLSVPTAGRTVNFPYTHIILVYIFYGLLFVSNIL